MPRRRARLRELRLLCAAGGDRLLGNIAMLAGLKRRVEWDGAAMRCTNRPDLNRFLKPAYRDGWTM